jgi:hypothetical protein
LPDHALGFWINQYRPVRVVVNVYETRGDDQAFRIDGLCPGGLGQISDSGDLPVTDPDVGFPPRVAGTVYNLPVFNQDIELQ